MSTIKVGVIGTGALGRHHARLYKECNNAEVVGIYDNNPESAAKVAAEFDLPIVENMDALVAMADGISVAVPTDLHFDIVSGIIKTGTHVLVEKPLTTTSTEGRTLVQRAESAGVVLHVGHVENFNPVIKYLRSKLTSPLFMEAHRLAAFPPSRPGLKPRGTEVGVVHDLMIHDLDLILDLVHSPVVRVDAVGMPVLSPLEDIANARIVFENGCVANVTASRISPELMRKIRVFQPDTYISLDYGEQCGEIYSRGATGITREEVPIKSGNALKVELENFIAGVEHFQETGNLPSLGVSGTRALSALELADEIVSKLKTHIAGQEQLSSLIGPTGFLDGLNG